jgi:hypothetical protein
MFEIKTIYGKSSKNEERNVTLLSKIQFPGFPAKTGKPISRDFPGKQERENPGKKPKLGPLADRATAFLSSANQGGFHSDKQTPSEIEGV